MSRNTIITTVMNPASPAQVLRDFVDNHTAIEAIRVKLSIGRGPAGHLWTWDIEHALRRAIRKLQRRLVRAEAKSKARRRKP